MSYNLVDPTTGDLTRVAGSIDTSIIPSNASASNKLVTHQVPYELFTLNNNSGSQKWYKLGKYEEGNYTARLDFVSARVDGEMFESSVRICGTGTDANYVSWIGEKGCEISTITVKVDSARNLYIKMNSYSAVEIRVYGTFTLDIVEQSSEPSGVQIVLNKLATESDLNSKGVFKGHIEPNKKLTINMDPYSEVYGYVQVQGAASIPFRLHNAAMNATPRVFLKESVTINEETVYVDKPFGTTVTIGSVTITNINDITWTITNTSNETESYWVGGGANSVTLSDV